MARRTFEVVDVTEIFIHWYAGRSISEVSASLGVDRKTIRKYLAPAVAAGLAPGGPAMTAADWSALVTGWFPQLADTRLRQTTWPQIAGAETDPPPPSAGDGGAAAHLHGPSQLFANVVPLPTPDTALEPDPATTNEHRAGPGDSERDGEGVA